MSQTRQLAAIMFTDIVGYTALMGNDEQKAFQYLEKNRALHKPIIEQFNGRWIKELGDGIMASFTIVSDAVNAAIKIQEGCDLANHYQLRIGIHLGEVVFENDDIFGDAVNIAARIQSAAKPGCIYVSESVHHNIANKKDIQSSFVKEETLKNVKEPVRIYEVMMMNNATMLTESLIKATSRHSIAVLSFANMSSDPEQEFFSDGISEEIINMLAQVPGLKVAGRTSAFSFKGKNQDLRFIGTQLNVNHILEGSVRSSGNRIRITAQLIDVQNGYHLWSEKYDRVLNDIFEVQDEIAQAIVEKLQITLGGKLVETKSREQTQSVAAYQYYLKGRALSYKRGKHMFEALINFQNALEIDPEYALAYAGLADTYTVLCYYGLSEPQKTWPRAIACAKKSLQLGPYLAESHNCNAIISLFHDWNWQQSEKQFQNALRINPGFEQAYVWYGLFYIQYTLGQHEEAIKTLRIGLSNNPLSFYSNSVLGLSLAIAGQYEEAIELSQRGADIAPDAYIAQLFLAQAYTWSGQYEKALAPLEKALTLSGRHSWALLTLTMFYAYWSKKEKALQTYEELLEQSRLGYIQPSILACAAAFVDYPEEALRFANLACQEQDPYLILVCKVYPVGNALRALAGFDEVLKKMNLPD